MSGKPYQHGLFERLEPRLLLAGDALAATGHPSLNALGPAAAGALASPPYATVDARAADLIRVVSAPILAPLAVTAEPAVTAVAGDQRAEPTALEQSLPVPLPDKQPASGSPLVQAAPAQAIAAVQPTHSAPVSTDPASRTPTAVSPVQSPPAREPMERSAAAPVTGNGFAKEAEQSLAVARSIAVKLPSVSVTRETSAVSRDGNAGGGSRVVEKVKQIGSSLLGVVKIHPAAVSVVDISSRDADDNVKSMDLSNRGDRVLATAAVRQEAFRVTTTVVTPRDAKVKETTIDATAVKKDVTAADSAGRPQESIGSGDEAAAAVRADPAVPAPETAGGDGRVAAAAIAPPPPVPETTEGSRSEATPPAGQDVADSSVPAPFDQPAAATGDTPTSTWPTGSGGAVGDQNDGGVERLPTTATPEGLGSDAARTDAAPAQSDQGGSPVTAALLTVTMGNPLTRLVVAADGGDQGGTGSGPAMPRGAAGLGRRRRRRSAATREGLDAEIDETTEVGWHGPPPDGSANRLADLAMMTYLEDSVAPDIGERARVGPATASATGTDWYQTGVVIGAGSLAGGAALLALDRRRCQPRTKRRTKPARPRYTGSTVQRAGTSGCGHLFRRTKPLRIHAQSDQASTEIPRRVCDASPP